MKLRIFTEPQQGATFDQLLRVAKATEDLGFDAFFRSDHYMRIGGGDPGPGSTDAWVTLGAIARETSRIRLGTLVTPITFRLPGPLAITVAQVDQMSNGRIELGLGSGWYGGEHEAYGIPFPPNPELFDRFAEQLEIVDGLLSTPEGETYSFDGKYYQLADAPALPKPAQSPRPPIILGGAAKKRGAALTATYADEFNVAFRDDETTNGAFDRVRAACAETGRDVALSIARTVTVGQDDADYKRRVAALGGRNPEELRRNHLGGTPSEIVDKIGSFAEMGASRTYLQFLALDDIEQLEILAADVLPHFAG